MVLLPTTNPSEILWESTDARKLREFLESVTGQKVLRHLSDSIPLLLSGEDVNTTLVRSGEVKGAQLIFSSLVSLIVEQPAQPKEKETYPDLDNESAWVGEQPQPTT